MDITKEFLRDKRKEEYQFQHFQFTTSILKNELKDIEMSIIEDALEKMERSLIGKYPTKTQVIQSATKKLTEEYAQKTDEWASSIEGKLESTFIGIPSHILLPEDKPQIKQYDKEYEEQVQTEMKELEKKLLQAKFMDAKLKQVLRGCEKCLKVISKEQGEEVEAPGEVAKEFLEPTAKLLSDLGKLDEGCIYISDKLMYSSSHEETPSFGQKNLRLSKELS